MVVSLLLSLILHGGLLLAAVWHKRVVVVPTIQVEGGTGAGRSESLLAGDAGAGPVPIAEVPELVDVTQSAETPIAMREPELLPDLTAPPSALESRVPQALPPSDDSHLEAVLAAAPPPNVSLRHGPGRPAFAGAASGAPGDASMPSGGVVATTQMASNDRPGIGEGPGGLGMGGGPPMPRSGNKPPRYPAEALRNRWEGTVVLNVRVRADGSVGRIELGTSSGHDVLDQAAIEAVGKWRYNPATVDGEPTECDAPQPLQFVLRS